MSSASVRFGTKAYVSQGTSLGRENVSNTSTSAVKTLQNTSTRSWHYIRTVCC